MKAILICFAVLAVSSIALSQQWGPQGCAPVGRVETGDRWDGDETETALFRNGVQVGSWSYTGGYWRDYDAKTNTWGPKSLVPLASPPPCPVQQKPVVTVTRSMPMADDEDDNLDLTDPRNHGVDMSKIADHQASYGGRRISCDKAIELIGKEVPDDVLKFRVVIIGTEAERKDALKQYAMIEPEYKDRCNVWDVEADHWSLKDNTTGKAIFKTDGNPVIYLQSPEGKVLHRQDDAKDFPQAIRKAVKAYDATKDPNLLHGSGPRAPIHPALPVAGLLAASVLAIYLKGK